MAWIPEDNIGASRKAAQNFWQTPAGGYGDGIGGGLAAALSGLGYGLMNTDASNANEANQTMRSDLMKSAASAPNNMSMGKLLMMGGVPDLEGQGMSTIAGARDKAEAYGQQKSMAEIQHKNAVALQGGSQAHAEKMAYLQQQLQLKILAAKDEQERKSLLEKGRALGLIPPEAAAPTADPTVPGAVPPAPMPQPAIPGASAGGSVPMPQPPPGVVPGVPQPQASAVPPAPGVKPDPYQALVQPPIPKAQQEAEMRKRAGQTLLMGDPKGAAKIMNKEDDPKEYQTKDALWAERMGRAEITLRGNIGTPDNPTYNPGSKLNRFWPDDGVLGMANSEKWKTYQGGAREWIAALLRKDTGAAVTQNEWDLYFPTYFPQPGDSPKVQAEKLERRIAEARKLRASSGPVFDRMNPNFDQEMSQRLQQQNGSRPAAGSSPAPSTGKIQKFELRARAGSAAAIDV